MVQFRDSSELPSACPAIRILFCAGRNEPKSVRYGRGVPGVPRPVPCCHRAQYQNKVTAKGIVSAMMLLTAPFGKSATFKTAMAILAIAYNRCVLTKGQNQTIATPRPIADRSGIDHVASAPTIAASPSTSRFLAASIITRWAPSVARSRPESSSLHAPPFVRRQLRRVSHARHRPVQSTSSRTRARLALVASPAFACPLAVAATAVSGTARYSRGTETFPLQAASAPRKRCILLVPSVVPFRASRPTNQSTSLRPSASAGRAKARRLFQPLFTGVKTPIIPCNSRERVPSCACVSRKIG